MASWEISSLEFAFILPAFLVLLMGTIDVARYLYTVQALVGLMGEAGRVAIMAGHPDWPQCPNQASNWWPQTATIAPLLDANNVYLCITPGGLWRRAPHDECAGELSIRDLYALLR